MSEIYDEGLLPPNVHPSRTDRRVAGETETDPSTETETDPKTESETDPKTETETSPKTETKTDPQTESETDPRTETESDGSNSDRPAPDQQAGDVADQGLLPPNVKPSRTDRTADAESDAEGAVPAQNDTDDQLPGTDDGLHGEAGADRVDGPSTSDPLQVPTPEPDEVPERDPEIAPPTAPERAPAPEEDPEVAPLTDPEFDFRDPQRPEGTPI